MTPTRASETATGGAAPPARLRVTVAADALGVRAGLAQAADWATGEGLAADDVQALEIVLAEGLNNVVEHAYRGFDGAPIAVRLRLDRTRITVLIADEGHRLPRRLDREADAAAPVGPDPADLPEGGFGWALICCLSCSVRYRRVGGRNLLRLILARGSASASLR